MKTLVITEKPSVARDIARALGSFKSEKEYLESDQYIISWALGHIVELYEPEDYDKRYRYWTLKSLPIVPEEFKFKTVEKTAKRFRILEKFIKSKEVKAIVNACDAGREGELIFREIILLASPNGKEIKRLWLSAMTEEEIIKEFKNLKDASIFDNLGKAAFARTEADWLVGINSTRAFTRRWGTLLSVGRVQTPTLNMICEREEEVRNFKPEKYFELEGLFNKNEFEYKGTYFDANGATRFKEAEELEKIASELKGKNGKIKDLVIKENKVMQPLLYDLTELQRDANKQYGYSAQKTLDIAQRLYESKKLITYPRTDSRYLPSLMKSTVPGILSKLKKTEYATFVERIQISGIKFSQRIINDAGVTDHFAIIPTGETGSIASLRNDEANIFNLVLKRFLSVFLEPAIQLKVSFTTDIESRLFKTSLSQIKKAGWMEVYGEKSSGDFTFIRENESVNVRNLNILEKETQPPQRFTDATLLSAMENAGKLVEEQELREAMKEKGLGTPATRASIIERLIEVGYIERVGKSLFPTDKGMRLIELAKRMKVEEILSPALTGKWEKKLLDIEKGKANPQDFMKGIVKLTKSIVEKVKEYKEKFSINSGSDEPVGHCPKCGAKVFEQVKGFACENTLEKKCDFVLWKKLKNKSIDRNSAEKLLKGETVRIPKMLSANKKYFDASIRLENGELKFVFEGMNQDKINPEPIGDCPNCKGKVYEGKDYYFCDGEKDCRFRLKKIWGNRPIKREEVAELLSNRKTSILNGFQSKKGRAFSGFFVLNEKGSPEFEFVNEKGEVKKSAHSGRRRKK